nr:beta-ketoacyl synthase N-terminal-like domain-containing protein [Salinispora arenicola]
MGIGCRLPGAADPSAFWRLLVNRHDALRPVPQRRRDLLGNADIDDTSFRWGVPRRHRPVRPASSGSHRAKPPRWTRSSGCCWRSPGRRWRMPA